MELNCTVQVDIDISNCLVVPTLHKAALYLTLGRDGKMLRLISLITVDLFIFCI